VADELRYAMSVTPIIENSAAVDSQGETAHNAVDSRAARISNYGSLFSHGNTPKTSDEDAYEEDENGDLVLQHTTSGGAAGNLNIIEVNGCNAYWVKNTGFKYDASKIGNIDRSKPVDTAIELYCATTATSSSDFCILTPGDSIFVPKPASTALSINDNAVGDPVAVELVIYT